jgi:hypothetical protein
MAFIQKTGSPGGHRKKRLKSWKHKFKNLGICDGLKNSTDNPASKTLALVPSPPSSQRTGNVEPAGVAVAYRRITR